MQSSHPQKEGSTKFRDLGCLLYIFAENIPFSIVYWYLKEESMHTEKATDSTTCNEGCDILLHLIKRLFNKSEKCMTRDSILHSHISVSQGHSLAERCFQY